MNFRPQIDLSCLIVDGLFVVKTRLDTSSAIADFAHPFYETCISPQNLLVLLPGIVSFYGHGKWIMAMRDWPSCWFGGALPDKGFWGAPIAGKEQEALVINRFTSLFEQFSTSR